MQPLIPTLAAAAALAFSASALAEGMQISKNGSRHGMLAPDAHFTGTAYVEMLFDAEGAARSNGASVTFLPGARSDWHTHPGGQVLIVTDGTGWVQEAGGERIEMHPGDVIVTPPGVKHWHGATATTAVTHHAIQQFADGSNVVWQEAVTDAQYKGDAE